MAERRRAQVAQALARLVGQAADFRVIDVERQPQLFVVLLPIDLVGLPFEIPRVFRVHFHLQRYLLLEAIIGSPHSAPLRGPRRDTP